MREGGEGGREEGERRGVRYETLLLLRCIGIRRAMAAWAYMIYNFIDARASDLRDGTRFVVMLLDWDKPKESVTTKDSGLYICWHTWRHILIFHDRTLPFVPGIHQVKYPSSFMVEWMTSDFSSATVLADFPQIA